ncbi:hypothetical protein [Tenacibaculum sp. nBUS_03]|uniref:hypothetical protein n=1 Tax=Tenacibaculum sp. nBUS_03 TaxID=3395320 RepID=UPI003EBF8652
MTIKISIFIFILSTINSCSQSVPKTMFDKNGGIIISLKLEPKDSSLLKKLNSRLETYAKIKSLELNTSENKNIFIFKLPFVIKNNELDQLLFTKGEINILDEANYFKKDFIERFFLDNGFMGPQINIKFKNNEQLKILSTQNLNKSFDILIDSTLVSNARFTTPFTNGTLPFQSKKNNTETLYSIIKTPYQEPFIVKEVKKNIFLKAGKRIIKLSPILYDNYNNIRKLTKPHTSIFYNVSDRTLSQSDKYYSEQQLDGIINNSFGDFIAEYQFKNVLELKRFFLEIQTKFEKYKNQFDKSKQKEIELLIQSISIFINNKIFESS